MDGEVCREERSPPTTAEGHHISHASFAVLGLFIPGVGRALPAGCVPPTLGLSWLRLFIHLLALCFL